MVSPNRILATVAAFITMFVLGYVIYDPLLGGFFEANAGTATGTMKEAPVFWQIIIGQLCGALLLVTVLSWRGTRAASEGFSAGATLGLLLSLYFGFMMLGTMNTTTMNAVVADAIISLMLMGVAGSVATVILRRG